jgi:putative nucleotidyltransferase with HDIG domain
MLDNLESIIENGILCTNIKNSRAISHANVAEQGIQGRRSSMPVTCSNGYFVHDYVPLYFSKKTSMQLGLINRKNVDQPLIIYLAISIEIIEEIDGVVFTDASANTDIPPNFFSSSDIDKLNSLNWKAIDDKKWGCPNDEYRHQKMAELLVLGIVTIKDISHIVVWNEWVKKEVEKTFKAKGIVGQKIIFSPDHYYTNFYDGGRNTIVTGPRALKEYVDATVSEICEGLKGSKKFENIRAALDCIAKDFSSIKELDDIDGLKASYGPHSNDVGTHSRKVATALTNFSEYNELSQVDKDIVQLAAYLHDIGKGPKTRWTEAGMTRADNDHAVKSLPMLKRILTEDIGNLSRDVVRKIVILVAYDDLIGDIVAKERNEQQLFDIIESENDLNMLVALGMSDMRSINVMWTLINNRSIKALKSRAIDSLERESQC